jgi:hypothetical protein
VCGGSRVESHPPYYTPTTTTTPAQLPEGSAVYSGVSKSADQLRVCARFGGIRSC